MSRYRMALVSSVVLASAASLAVLAISVAALTKPAAPHAVQGTLGVTASMAIDRAAHTATALPDGRVLVAGGFVEKGSPAGAEVYDAATGGFSPLPPMIETRHSHSATLLPDGAVLIAGGYGAGTTTLQTAELFDPNTRTFTSGPSLVLPRYKHAGTSVLLPSGRVRIAGGAPQAETCDPATHTFTLVPGEARMAGLFPAVAPLGSGGGVLITGGYGQGRGPRASAWLYEP